MFNKKKSVPTVEERTVHNMKVGDIVTYDLEDYQVVGRLDYNDHGFKWTAYQLQGDQNTIWLSVEMDDELELGIYRKVPSLKLTEPIPKDIAYDGVKYHLNEQGSARIKGTGRCQNVDGMTIDYYDFSDDEEEQFLSVEKWGSQIEVSSGYEIEEYEIKILAGS
nr:DUF4178 domain-containing protein [Caldalkalibacillus salinus]